MAMPAFLAEVVFEFGVVRPASFDLGEASAEPNQSAPRLGTFAHDGVDGGAIAQAGARADGVIDMRFEGVVDAPHAGEAALPVRGVGLGAAGLGQHGDASYLGLLEGEGQGADAADDYQEVAEQLRVMPHQVASVDAAENRGAMNRRRFVVSI